MKQRRGSPASFFFLGTVSKDAVIRNALLTAVNRITLMDEKSGEFEAGDGNQNMVTFEVSE